MSLWRQPEFLKLWAGQTVSLLGSQVSHLAFSLTAAVVLSATPTEMGLIGTLNVLPLVLFGLPGGVWVDRVRRLPLLIATDVGRAALLLTVPVAALMGWLSMAHLYVVSFGLGCMTALFAVAYGSFLPSVVRRADLAEGNAKMALGEAVARVSGPGLAGGLVQVLTAPGAILVDCLSFIVSAGSLGAIHVHEAPPAPVRTHGFWHELREGFGGVFRHPLLRPLFVGSNLGNLGDGLVFQSGLLVLFMTRDLRFEPAVMGAVFAGLGVGGLLGAAVSTTATRVFGVGVTIVGSLGLWAVGYGGMAAVRESTIAPLIMGALLGAIGAINPVAGANISTVRQVVTPDRLLGRVTAVIRVGTWTSLTLGSFAGGVVADYFGVRPTLVLGGMLPLLGCVWLLVSPIVRLRQLGVSQYATGSNSQ